MGTITLSKANRLYWLGRYLERVFTAITATRDLFEAETDGDEGDYATYCSALGIANDYVNTSDFVRRYYFDAENPNSILSNLNCAFDNAIVLRETLSTETLAYVQMACSAMERAAGSHAPGVALQWVLDDIMAFRGSCEEKIDEEISRNIVKAGSSLERVDLYLRLNYPDSVCEKEFARLFNRLYKSQMVTNQEKLDYLVDAILDKTEVTAPRRALVGAVEGLFCAV